MEAIHYFNTFIIDFKAGDAEVWFLDLHKSFT